MKELKIVNETTIEVDGVTYVKESNRILETKQETGWERVKKSDTYYTINILGEIARTYETNTLKDLKLFEIANYNTNEKLMKRISFEESFRRRRMRWVALNDSIILDWKDYSINKYFVFYDHEQLQIKVSYSVFYQTADHIYVSSRDLADKMIEEFKDDFKRLFLSNE